MARFTLNCTCGIQRVEPTNVVLVHVLDGYHPDTKQFGFWKASCVCPNSECDQQIFDLVSKAEAQRMLQYGATCINFQINAQGNVPTNWIRARLDAERNIASAIKHEGDEFAKAAQGQLKSSLLFRFELSRLLKTTKVPKELLEGVQKRVIKPEVPLSAVVIRGTRAGRCRNKPKVDSKLLNKKTIELVRVQGRN